MKEFFDRLVAVAEAEVRYLTREPRTLLILLTQPLMMLVLYGYCVSFNLRHLPFAVWDQDRSETSRQFIGRLRSSGGGETFTLVGHFNDPRLAEDLLGSGTALFLLIIPPGFEERVSSGQPVRVQALFDGADPNTAGVAFGYLRDAVAAQNARLTLGGFERRASAATAAERGPAIGGVSFPTDSIQLRWRVFFNPSLDSTLFFIPGLIGVLMTFIAASMTATILVREKELGPMESLLTSPVGPAELVLGKMAPYVVVAGAIVLVTVLVAGFTFGIWPRGSALDLVSFSFLFLLGMLAMGMLISASAPSQQLALVAATFATLLPNMFLTGFAYPRSNMPEPLQWATLLMPGTHFITAIRGIFLKGVGWSVLWPQGLWMLLTTLLLLAGAIRRVGQQMQRGLE